MRCAMGWRFSKSDSLTPGKHARRCSGRSGVDANSRRLKSHLPLYELPGRREAARSRLESILGAVRLEMQITRQADNVLRCVAHIAVREILRFAAV